MSGTQTNAGTHGVTNHDVVLQAQRLSQCNQVIRLRIKAVIHAFSRFAQTATTHVLNVGIKVLAELLTHKTPGHRRAGNAGNDDDGRTLVTPTNGTTKTQVMLTNAIGVHMSAVQKCAHA
ncbi:hypothetical protein ACI0FN_03297 [Alcaligenes nematophilus]